MVYKLILRIFFIYAISKGSLNLKEEQVRDVKKRFTTDKDPFEIA